MNVETRYRNLNAYIEAKELVKLIYALLASFPKEEQFALCDQLRRAVISIPSNIVNNVMCLIDREARLQ